MLPPDFPSSNLEFGVAMAPSHPDHEGLEVMAIENYPEVVHFSDKEALPARVGKSSGARTCGLKRPAFTALLVIAVLVIVGAAVGGGAGAVLAAKKSKPLSTYVKSTIVLVPFPLLTQISQSNHCGFGTSCPLSQHHQGFFSLFSKLKFD